MCNALNDLMRPELDAAAIKGDAKRMVKTVLYIMKKQGITEADACDMLGYDIDEYRSARELLAKETVTV